MLRLTEDESTQLVLRVAALFQTHLNAFSAGKYPDLDYAGFLKAFAAPSTVDAAALRNALLWKYGHWNKSNYPQRHDQLIARVVELWADLVATLPATPSAVFTFLHMKSGVPYVSAAFLTHLLFPLDIPLIDQHNFRAMNQLIKAVRPGWTHRRLPSSYYDLLDLKAFLREILNYWSRTRDAPPSTRELDKFLMAYGKSIKN